jgi:hypothetical protein
MTEREINQRAAEQIGASGCLNGKRYQRGEWLALLDGKVVAASNTLDAAIRELRALEQDPQRGMIFQYGVTELDVVR